MIIVPRQIYVGESYRDISTEGEVGDKQEFLHFVYLVLLKKFSFRPERFASCYVASNYNFQKVGSLC